MLLCGGFIQATTPEQTAVWEQFSVGWQGHRRRTGEKKLMAAREFAIHHTLHKMEPEQAGTEQGLYLDNILHYVAEF